MPEPIAGGNIHIIWTEVLTEELLSYSQIKKILQKSFPSIPVQSFHVHVNNLVERGYAEKAPMEDGIIGFRRIGTPFKSSLLPPVKARRKKHPNKKPQNVQILDYLKKHIGKTVSSGKVKKALKHSGSAAWDIMKSFEKGGFLEAGINGKTTTYLILPTIAECDKPPAAFKSIQYKSRKTKKAKREIVHVEPKQVTLIQEPTLIQEQNMPNILDMSVGQLGNYITTLRDENLKLKQTIETMVHLAVQAGVVDQE